MNHYTAKDYLTVFGLVGAGGIAGWLLGSIGWGIAAGLAGWIFYQHLEYTSFRSWARRPLERPEFRTDAWQLGADALFRAGQRQRARTHQTLIRLRQLRAITDALPDAAIIIDPLGRIENVNSAARGLLGITPRDRNELLATLVRHPQVIALLKGEVEEGVVEFASPTDESVRLELRHVPVDDERALVLARDTTRLDRLLSMRQDFVANVSHELRTPLTVVIGYLEALTDEEVDDGTRRALTQKLIPPVTRMQSLVDDLLMLTRLESSPPLGETGPLSSICLPALIDAVLAETKPLAQADHRFSIRISSDARLLGSYKELYSALLNLVTNAIRYSPDGGEIRLAWTDTEGGTTLSVTDAGTGIGREHIDRLTERFYRVDLARSRTQGGTGLGLAIVKHVLKRHQTKLAITSELGKGSTFSATFPPSQLVGESNDTPNESTREENS